MKRVRPHLELITALVIATAGCRDVTGYRTPYSQAYVRGRVVDTAGTGLADARVAVQARPRDADGTCQSLSADAGTGMGRTRLDGAYGFTVTSVSADTAFAACLTVTADAGTGMAIIAWTQVRFVPAGAVPDTASMDFVFGP